MDNKKLILIIIAILILVVGGVGFWYWKYNWNIQQALEPEIPKEPLSSEGGLGAKIFEKAQNPIKDRTPETNPFSVDTNPFDAKTNPFQDEYKNPF